MTACALAYPCGVEVGTFKHYVARCFIRTAAFATEDAGNAHRFLGIADAEVVLSERMFLTVEGNELGSFGLCAHHNLVTCHHVCVEAVKRLSVGHHYIVGDVHDVVYRAQTYRAQLVLQPLRTLLHVASGQAYAGVAAAGFLVFDVHFDGQIVVVHGEVLAVRTVQTGFMAVALEPCVEVASHSPVRECVGAVGRDVYLDEPVALHVVIFSRRLSHRCVVRQYDDTVVTCANANFVFSANHSEAVHSTEF